MIIRNKWLLFGVFYFRNNTATTQIILAYIYHRNKILEHLKQLRAVMNNAIQTYKRWKKNMGEGKALLLKPISALAATDCSVSWKRVIASSFRWSRLYPLVLLTVLVGTHFVHGALRRLTCAHCLESRYYFLWRQQVSVCIADGGTLLISFSF